MSHVAGQFSSLPLPYCSPPGCPFPIKSLALSAHVSPQTIHFQVLDKSPVLGPGRGLPSCNTVILFFFLARWFYIELSEELPSHFPQWLHHFTVPPALHKGSNFSSSSTTSVIFHFFDNNHPNRCEDVSHCGFDLHVLIGHLFIFFGEMSTNVPGPFFIKSSCCFFVVEL